MIDFYNISLIILAVAFGAAADGFNEKYLTDLGHPLEAFEKVFLLMAGLVSGSWLVIISYTAFRISIFDIIKNLVKGDPWSYLGDSCWWDRFLSKYPVSGVTFARIIVLAFAVGFTIKEL